MKRARFGCWALLDGPALPPRHHNGRLRLHGAPETTWAEPVTDQQYSGSRTRSQ
ncbi:hypothetical protein [Streptomyces sp. NPDC048644]|uniref:hypothetical protein n=1 Tax=Streptomyces sp. NPDC048644 TaxID=3365582 RepID=UPI003715EC40